MNHKIRLVPAKLKKLREIDPALTSYNIEMTELTGGTFWKAYTPAQIAGIEPFVSTAREDMLQEYPPVNLDEPRIRTLAKALGPVWIRTSGTWATRTYYDFDGRLDGSVPEGFDSVLTREQWEGVLDFVRAVDGKLLVSVSNCEGVHNSDGVWDSAQAKLLFDFSKDYGVPISAAEFTNEPNLLEYCGAPAGYTAQDLFRDQDLFFRFVRANYPEVLLVGPSATCDTDDDADFLENSGGPFAGIVIVPTEEIMANTQIMPDVLSYHYYNGTSERGASMGGHWAAESATTEPYLKVCEDTCKTYLPIRDRYCPDAPIWVTESGEGACGGSTWASTYLDVIRTVNELGRFAQLTNGIIFHNTLASSDYGLLDRETHLPRPDYWATLLWSRLMGTTVYDTGEPIREGAHLFAHSRKDGQEGVAYVIVNNSLTETTQVELPQSAMRYTLSAKTLRSTEILLNGVLLQMVDDYTLPELEPLQQQAGWLEISPATVTFLIL